MKTSNRQRLKHATLMAFTTLFSSAVLANSYTDYAKVTHVTPIYESIAIEEPRQQCHYEERAVRHPHKSGSATSTIVGALIGGAIGDRLGHNKSNKRVGAVAGAILGGSIARDLSHKNGHKSHHGHHTRTEKVCHTSYTTRHEKQISGYDVSYHYRGQTYHTVMDYHPDDRIKVAVDVRPVDY